MSGPQMAIDIKHGGGPYVSFLPFQWLKLTRPSSTRPRGCLSLGERMGNYWPGWLGGMSRPLLFVVLGAGMAICSLHLTASMTGPTVLSGLVLLVSGS